MTSKLIIVFALLFSVSVDGLQSSKSEVENVGEQVVKSINVDEVKQDLKSLCENNPTFELTRISQVRKIVELIKSQPDLITECPQRTRDALSSIKPIVSDSLDDVCSMAKVDQIYEYHFNFIAQFGVHFATDKNSGSIPRALSRFFIAFALSMSSVCKKTMINSLVLDTQHLNEDDMKSIEVWTNNKGGLVQSLGSGPRDFDDLLLIRDFARFDDSDNEPMEKVYIQTGSIEMLTKIQTLCKRRFKPIYGRLILPLVSLSNAGYNYEGEDLERELSELKTNELVNKWYKITYLCETLEDIELVEDPTTADKVVGFDRSFVRILTKDEANELRMSKGLFTFEDDSWLSSKEQTEFIENIDYGVPLDDVVVDHENKELLRLINNFDATTNEAEKARKKLFIRVGHLIKDLLIKRSIKIVSSLFKKSEHKQNNLSDNINQESFYTEQRRSAIKAIDDYVQQVSLSQKGTIDRPVAGLRDYGRRVYHNAKFTVAHKGNYPGAEEELKRKGFPVAKLIYRSLAVIALIVACILFFTG